MAEDISSRVAWALKKALTPKGTETGKGRGRATFVRRDERGTAWVRIPGNDFDTPVAGGIAADSEPGDTILYDISNGRVSITGNDTSPSVGERFVGRAMEPVRQSVAKMGNAVASSIGIAQAAQRVADAVNQHFWTDTSGIHVTDVTQEEWEQQADGSNILINSLGFLLRNAETWLASFTDGAVAFYDGLGNTASNLFARFGTDGAQIGYDSTSHLELDYHSMRLVDMNGGAYFDVNDLRDADGGADVTDRFVGDGSTTRYLFTLALGQTEEGPQHVYVDGVETAAFTIISPNRGIQFTTAPASGSVIEIVYVTESDLAKSMTFGTRDANSNVGPVSQSFGLGNDVSGYCSSAFGQNNSAGSYIAHAEGYGCVASGGSMFDEGGSHAEGVYCEATGPLGSHAEGEGSHASGASSHAEGGSTASGDCAHSEGSGTTASGTDSHAQNSGTTAEGDSQTVLGKFNEPDTTSAVIIGNGTSPSNLSNAMRIEWDGSVDIVSASARNATDHMLGSAKTAGDTITMNNVMAMGFLNANKTYCNLCIPMPFRFYGVSGATLAGTYTIRQYNGVFLFGSNASTAPSLSGHVGSVAVNENGFILANIGGSAQGSSATAQGVCVCQFNTLTITLS